MTGSPPNRLRELREAQGLRLEHLALEFDVSTKTIERWEREGIPNLAKANKLAKHFSVSTAFLLRWDEQEVAA